jgi:hypothetical protein
VSCKKQECYARIQSLETVDLDLCLGDANLFGEEGTDLLSLVTLELDNLGAGLLVID